MQQRSLGRDALARIQCEEPLRAQQGAVRPPASESVQPMVLRAQRACVVGRAARLRGATCSSESVSFGAAGNMLLSGVACDGWKGT
eukprot:6057017-Prymnesium_polylepis.1